MAFLRGGMGIIDIRDLSLNFGGVLVLMDVTIEIGQNSIFSIIGPNGAGKTSLLNCINGLYRPQSGEILFDGKDITHMASHKIAAMGIGRTFQNVELFRNMTVLENLLLGYHNSLDCGPIAGGIFLGKGSEKEIEARKRAEDVIDFLETLAAENFHCAELAVGAFYLALSNYQELNRNSWKKPYQQRW